MNASKVWSTATLKIFLFLSYMLPAFLPPFSPLFLNCPFLCHLSVCSSFLCHRYPSPFSLTSFPYVRIVNVSSSEEPLTILFFLSSIPSQPEVVNVSPEFFWSLPFTMLQWCCDPDWLRWLFYLRELNELTW